MRVPSPPARFSHDSNIYRQNVTDGAGRPRYSLPGIRITTCLACRGARALHMQDEGKEIGYELSQEYQRDPTAGASDDGRWPGDIRLPARSCASRPGVGRSPPHGPRLEVALST